MSTERQYQSQLSAFIKIKEILSNDTHLE